MNQRRRVLLVVGWFAVAIALAEYFAVPSFVRSVLFTPETGPRYVFLDGGAHKGESVSHFQDSLGCALRPWEIFAFEPNPELHPFLSGLRDVTMIGKALAGQNGTTSFHFGKTSLEGSIVGEKKRLIDKEVNVELLDLSEWIKSQFSADDFVWLKLDVEGAEYEILRKILSDGNAHLLDILSIEFHNKWLGVDKAEDKRLVEQLIRAGVRVQSDFTFEHGDWFSPRSCFYWMLHGLDPLL